MHPLSQEDLEKNLARRWVQNGTTFYREISHFIPQPILGSRGHRVRLRALNSVIFFFNHSLHLLFPTTTLIGPITSPSHPNIQF